MFLRLTRDIEEAVMRTLCQSLVCCSVVAISSLSLAYAESQSHAVQVSATILPRLELSVAPSTGSAIAFGAIMQPADGDVATKTVAVNLSVFSNLDRPYAVTQSIRHPLTNEQGIDIPNQQFLVSGRDATRGELGMTTPVAVVAGESATLYTSDAHGKSDAFVADYQLAVTPATPAGNFGTEIVYTVTSL